MVPEEKKSCITSTTSAPTVAQKILKKEAENPSGLGVFELDIEKMTFFISLSSGMEINLSFSSSVTNLGITPISLTRNLGLSHLYRL